MRKLDTKLAGQALPGIVRAWEVAATRMGAAGDLKLNNRKAKPGPMLTGLVLYLMEKVPEAELLEMVRRGLRMLEDDMNEGGSVPPPPPPDLPDPIELPVKVVRRKGANNPASKKPVDRKKLD